MIHTSNCSLTDLVFSELKNGIDTEDRFIVLILDEMDKIVTKRDEDLYNILRLNSYSVIPLCASFAAQTKGDAGSALELLRESGKIAELSRSNKVTEVHVRLASEMIAANSMEEVVKTLPLQSKIFLGSVLALTREKNEESFISGDVYNTYRSLCDRLGVAPLTQRRSIDLISDLDFFGLINAVIVCG